MTQYSAHFRIPIPDFEQEPWHDELETSLRQVDQAIYEALFAAGAALWENDHEYFVGDIALDDIDGQLYVCAINHTSPSTPVTFTTFRGANPTFWNAIVTIPQFRGTWATATSYIKGDFVIDNQRYAVAVISHVSTVFNTDLGNGKWAVLIDLTSIQAGFNENAEGSIASASTTDIGAETPSRLAITGSATITSFGTVANKYKMLRYTGAAIVTHNATTLILLGGANRTMRAGDVQILTSNASGQWREIAFFRADGNPATETERGVVELATVAEVQAGIDTERAITAAGFRGGFDNRFFPAGTKMLFQQTNAPVGWTKDVVHNDKALRVVSGAASSGGTLPFSTVFARTATDAHTLTVFELPSHAHTITDPGHFHNVTCLDGSTNNPGGQGTSFLNAGANNHTTEPAFTGINQANAFGGGGSHTHAIDIRVQYVDLIIATKD